MPRYVKKVFVILLLIGITLSLAINWYVATEKVSQAKITPLFVL